MEQRLGGVDVADADHHPGIHDDLLDGGIAALALCVQILGIECRRQRLRPEVGQQRVPCWVVGPQYGAEAARIAQTQRGAVIEQPVDVVVQRGRLVGFGKTQAARHAQVHDLRGRPEIEQQVFAAPGESPENMTRQPCLQIARYRPAQAGVAHHNVLEDAAPQTWQQAQAGGFDFG